MAKNPEITWYKGSNEETAKVTTTVDLGRIDADTVSNEVKFYIWNNRGGTEGASNAEELTITARDTDGGDGTTIGKLVPSISEDWNQVRVDSLEESSFTPIGKGGVGKVNPSGVKLLGTNGATKNVDFESAVEWSAEVTLSLGDFIKPTVDNGFFFEVVQAGVTGTTEPTYLLTEGLRTEDGSVQLKAIRKEVLAPENTLLGMKNNTLPDGSNAEDAGGNFVKFSHRIEVPITASSGKQSNLLKASYKFV